MARKISWNGGGVNQRARDISVVGDEPQGRGPNVDSNETADECKLRELPKAGYDHDDGDYEVVESVSEREMFAGYPEPKTFNKVLTEIPFEELWIDRRYQRKEKESINWLTENFTWFAFEPPTVACRQSTGRYFVVEGQQRTIAARRRGYQMIPCLVFHSRGYIMESRIYTTINKNRARQTQHELHKANKISGMEEDRILESVLGAHGIEVSTSVGKVSDKFISSIATYKKRIVAYGEPALDFAIRVAQACWPGERMSTDKELIGALMRAYVHDLTKPVDESRVVTVLKGHVLTDLLKDYRSKSENTHVSLSKRIANCVSFTRGR